MGRQSGRRRAQRNGNGKPVGFGTDQRIELQNPVGVADQYPAWILGNAEHWEAVALEHFERVVPAGTVAAMSKAFQPLPLIERMRGFLAALDEHHVDRFVAEQDSAKGKHLILCGAGPSLADHAAEYCPQGDQVWGCNSAMTFLFDRSYPVTHGYTVDQTPMMLQEWASTPDVEYLIASTVHPHLTQLLRGRGRRLRFFHNFVGIARPPVDCGGGEIMSYEDWLYSVFFPATVRTGAGLNAVNRAVDLALYMGFARISVLGADCSLRFDTPAPKALPGSPENRQWLKDHTVMHADGGHAMASEATAMTLTGTIDGREWLTKPDMIISAVHLEMARRHHPEIEIVGDTLPQALKGKPEAFLKRLPHMVGADGAILPLA